MCQIFFDLNIKHLQVGVRIRSSLGLRFLFLTVNPSIKRYTFGIKHIFLYLQGKKMHHET